MLTLVSNNPNPAPADEQTEFEAQIARAKMEVDNAPASYFGEGVYVDDEDIKDGSHANKRKN